MNHVKLTLVVTLFAALPCPRAIAQTTASALEQHSSESSSAALASSNVAVRTIASTASSMLAPEQLFYGEESNLKFDVNRLMNVLRDSRHEGWVLAAYPDPKTSRPLIGAGFSLDVTATEHPQRDPLNPHQFMEPSSAQLWQAAGLDPERLQNILDSYGRDLAMWKKKKFRRKIKTRTLAPEVTEQEAISLLRVSALQAVHNARAYCRNFDELTASQQMALSQLVFQMGVNLEEFTQFLDLLNNDVRLQEAALPQAGIADDREHWGLVQRALIESQWAKRYSKRAVAVIAMFNPNYLEDPREAERQVQYAIHPQRKHHHRRSRA